MVLDRPDEFSRKLHPSGIHSGQIILERRFQKSVQQALVTADQLERISKSNACQVANLFCSAASFSGPPLVLNFEQTTAICLQVDDQDLQTYTKLVMRLAWRNIPTPTLAITDDETLTLLWLLEKPIPSNEFYRFSVLQCQIHAAAVEFNPDPTGRDITSLIRMIGSVNPKTGRNAAIKYLFGKIYDLDRLEGEVLRGVCATKFKRSQQQAGLTLELHALFCNRWWTHSQRPEMFEDWLIFYGAALAEFCSKNQLTLELTAIIESLENNDWKNIKEKYEPLLNSIINTAELGYIKHSGIHLALNSEHWTDLVRGKLEISNQEIAELNLRLLSGTSTFSPLTNLTKKTSPPVGRDTFVPLGRLLMHGT